MDRDWASKLVKNITPTKETNAGLLFATVASISPIVLEINSQKIKKHIYMTSGISIFYEDSVFDDNTVVDDKNGRHNLSIKKWFSFLRNYHKSRKLQVGDEVIVLRRENEFYIISKVMK